MQELTSPETQISHCQKEMTGTRSWVRPHVFRFLCFMFFFLLIHIRPNTFYIWMQMWDLRDQLGCLQSHGGLSSPLILRETAPEERR